MAHGLAVYASQAAVTHGPRKTRFRLVVNLYRAGLVTRRVSMRSFRSSHSLLQSFLAQSGNESDLHSLARVERAHAHSHDIVSIDDLEIARLA